MRGWLHTRYAPVRHSHSPEGEFPSDLHVLGLPLAFILSQDQTLHCSIVVLFLFPVLGLRYDSSVPYPRTASRRPEFCFLCWPQAFKELCPPFFPSLLPWGRKRLQNYSFFLYVQLFSQLFFIYFQIIFLHLDYQRNTNTKKRDGALHRLYILSSDFCLLIQQSGQPLEPQERSSLRKQHH